MGGVFLSSVRTAGSRLILGGSRRSRNEVSSWPLQASSWRFLADSQRICSEFLFRLALDSIFAGFGGPGAAKMVPG